MSNFYHSTLKLKIFNGYHNNVNIKNKFSFAWVPWCLEIISSLDGFIKWLNQKCPQNLSTAFHFMKKIIRHSFFVIYKSSNNLNATRFLYKIRVNFFTIMTNRQKFNIDERPKFFIIVIGNNDNTIYGWFIVRTNSSKLN